MNRFTSFINGAYEMKTDELVFQAKAGDPIFYKSIVTGKQVDRLGKYEDLGYTPEQLEQIIRLYHIYKLQAHSTFGLCSGTKVGPDKLEVNIPKLIDEAMAKRDRSVSLYIGESGTSINIYPWPEEDCDE